ncbi:hypothetical protein EIP86_010510 [Pleurotus ostreatoroseus]|nr:hypothetical protein EIP86_010510 [Pleurotus ostreatoroseus]
MLSKSWFSPKSAGKNADEDSHVNDGQLTNNVADAGSRPSLERAVTAALSTPHDAVLAELQGQRPGTNLSAKIDASPEVPLLPPIPSQAELELNADASASASTVLAARAAAGAATIYDPATGSVAFTLPPTDAAASPSVGTGTATSAAHFEEAKDELWSQLGRIRGLQSEIARRHLQMEDIGCENGRGGGKSLKPPTRTHTDTIVVGEEWPDPAQAEQEREKALDAEFDNLTKTFEGRHAAIDGIMEKLDDLSKVLTTFHALPTPAMDFGSLRNNTKDSMTTMFSSPSPTFTTVPTSPIASPAPTTGRPHTSLQAQVASLDIPRAESPVSESVLSGSAGA